MPAYSYEALQADGALRKGVIEADSAKAARTQLRGQSLLPLSVAVIGGSTSAQAGTARSDRARALTPTPWPYGPVNWPVW